MFLNVVNRLSNNENVATKCLDIHCRLTERCHSDMYSCELHTYLPFMLLDCLSKYPQESALYNKSVSIFILNHKSGTVLRFCCTNTGYLLTPIYIFAWSNYWEAANRGWEAWQRSYSTMITGSRMIFFWNLHSFKHEVHVQVFKVFLNLLVKVLEGFMFGIGCLQLLQLCDI